MTRRPVLPFSVTVSDIPVLLSLLAVASFTASIIHNAGFENALGLGRGHVPITLVDHSTNTLLWLPPIVVAGFAIATFEITGRRLGLKSDNEVIVGSTNPVIVVKILKAVQAAMPWLILLLGSYVLLSNGEMQLSFFAGSCAAVWMVFASWSLRRSTPTNGWIWYAFVVVPAVSIVLFGFGWSDAARALNSTPDEIRFASEAPSMAQQVTVLRTYENGLLYSTTDGIVFTRWASISEIRMRGRTETWNGIRCSLSGCVDVRPSEPASHQ